MPIDDDELRQALKDVRARVVRGVGALVYDEAPAVDLFMLALADVDALLSRLPEPRPLAHDPDRRWLPVPPAGD